MSLVPPKTKHVFAQARLVFHQPHDKTLIKTVCSAAPETLQQPAYKSIKYGRLAPRNTTVTTGNSDRWNRLTSSDCSSWPGRGCHPQLLPSWLVPLASGSTMTTILPPLIAQCCQQFRDPIVTLPTGHTVYPNLYLSFPRPNYNCDRS